MSQYQNGFLVRELKKKTRFYTDNEFLDKGYASFFGRKSLIYFVLEKYANAKTQTCFPSYKTIMKETGIKNRNTIAKTINAFEYLNLVGIKRSKGRKPNIYYLLDSSQWKPLNSIILDTVRTVLKITHKQYQKWRFNSSRGDTKNHISKSTKEIKENNQKNNFASKEILNQMRRELSEKLGWKK
jgi:hypothetical protein